MLGGSPVKPLTAGTGTNTVQHGMDGVVVNQSLLELAATGQLTALVSPRSVASDYSWSK